MQILEMSGDDKAYFAALYATLLGCICSRLGMSSGSNFFFGVLFAVTVLRMLDVFDHTRKPSERQP